MKRKILSNRTITRLSLYYQYLSRITDKKFISSKDLAGLLGINDAKIRKDLASAGQFGIRGKGYEISQLHSSLEKVLGINRTWNVVIIGCGNLGSALLKYQGFSKHKFNIVAGFDIDKTKVNKEINGIKIYHFDLFGKFVKSNKIDIAVVTVPQEAASEVIDKVVSYGIKGILNFTPLQVYKKDCIILKTDITIEFIRLACLLANKK